LPLRLPFRAVILEIPDQFLLLGIHQDHWLPAPLEREDAGVDELELGIAIGVGAALPRLAIGLEVVSGAMQQQRHGLVADAVALAL
jgi:hypothetical protein